MADGKLRANTDELWHFFSDLNNAVDYLDDECSLYERKLRSIESRLQEKFREIQMKIEDLYGEISELKGKENDDTDDIAAKIIAIQVQIERLEEQKVRVNNFLNSIPEQLDSLRKKQKEYQYSITEGKRIVNRYLKMIEVIIVKKELTDYQESKVTGQYHAMNYRGTIFYCNDDGFDIDAIDSMGRSNLQRMESGMAPMGKDGKAIELHHMIQSEKLGGIVEVSGSMHRKEHKVLHINTHDIPSGINRSNFDIVRNAYWKRRAEFIKLGASTNE